MRYTKSSTVQMFRIIEGRGQGQIAGLDHKLKIKAWGRY